MKQIDTFTLLGVLLIITTGNENIAAFSFCGCDKYNKVVKV